MKIIPKLYKDYGLYVNKKKMLPDIRDGLLPVQKRILLTSHMIARNKYVKTSKILGETMARWHPHSEALGTAEWAVNNGFLDGGGLWGSNIGIEKIGCAQPRYTSIKSNNLIEKIGFKYINFVDWELAETEEPEPIYVPTMIPFCFMAMNEYISIGFGFRTEIPCFKLEDLINRLLYLLNRKDKVIIKPNIIGCKILSSKKECEKLLKEGRGKISLQGKYKINNNKTVSIFGWSPRTTYPSLIKKIDKYKDWRLLSRGDIGFIDESTGTSGTRIDFKIIKQRNKNEIFDKAKEAITESLKEIISYNIITIDNNVIKFPSVDEMLLNTYNLYKYSKEKYTKNKLEYLENMKIELKIIEIIRPYVHRVAKKFSGDIDKIYSNLYELLKDKISIDIDYLKSIFEKYKLKRLLTINIDIDKIDYEIKKSLNVLEHLEENCIQDYNDI